MLRTVFRRGRASILVVSIIAIVLMDLAGYVAFVAAEPSVVYYDLPSCSEVGKARTIRMGISPYNASEYALCYLLLTKPDGASEWLEAYPNETGYVSFSYAPNYIGDYQISEFSRGFEGPGSFGVTISHTWTVREKADTTPPSGTIMVNDGADETDFASVLLSVSAEDDFSAVTLMHFSNDGVSWSDWERYTVFNPAPSYVSLKNWTLAGGFGLKTVFVQFMNEAGLLSESFSDEIYFGLAEGSLSCSLSRSSLQIEESTTISGQISPAVEGAVVLIEARLLESNVWTLIGTVTTSQDGAFSYVWFPYAAGTWNVRASWEGNSRVSPCESPLQVLTIGLVQSSLSVSLSRSSLVAGESLTISGEITPPRDNAAISIQFRSESGSWSTLQVVYSDPDGSYSCSMSPSEVGTYEVRADWQGDEVTQPCTSQIRSVEIAPFPIIGYRELVLLVAAIGAISLPAIGYAAFVTRSPFDPAEKALDKLNKDLAERKYELGLGELDNLVKHVDKLVSSTKLPGEINKPPYSLKHNLETVKETLSQKVQEKTADNFLRKSEIRPYLIGLVCVLNTFRNLKNFKPLPRASSTSKFFVPLVAREAGVFDKVNHVDNLPVRDFWLIWENVEVEPIRIYFKNEAAVGARSRWHWRHIDIKEPYLDEKGRIEVLILPQFHTPIIRRSKEDVCFLVFAKCFCATVRSFVLVFNQPVAAECTESGRKTVHPPAVDYEGWEAPFKPFLF